METRRLKGTRGSAAQMRKETASSYREPPWSGLSVVEGYPLRINERTVQRMKYYLAYGSNLSVAQMLHRCPSAIYVGYSDIPGYRLLFRGSQTGSYLTIEPMKKRTVPVLVWMVEDEDEAALDLYEGYPRFYRKETMRVMLRSFANPLVVDEVDAFVYIMDESRPLGKPSENYYMVCLEGYIRFGFNTKILERAYRESTGKKHTGGDGR